MIYFCSLVLLVIAETALSTPIHSNTLGVVECQDELQAISLKHSVLSVYDCDRARQLVEEVLDSCRPSDPVRTQAILRSLLEAERCPKPARAAFGAKSASSCDFVFDCMRMPEDSSSLCGQGFSASKKKQCFQAAARGSCKLADKVGFIAEASSTDMCDGKACVRGGILYQQIPGNECEYMRTNMATGFGYRQKVAPGTTFSMKSCSPEITASSQCLS